MRNKAKISLTSHADGRQYFYYCINVHKHTHRHTNVNAAKVEKFLDLPRRHIVFNVQSCPLLLKYSLLIPQGMKQMNKYRAWNQKHKFW